MKEQYEAAALTPLLYLGSRLDAIPHTKAGTVEQSVLHIQQGTAILTGDPELAVQIMNALGMDYEEILERMLHATQGADPHIDTSIPTHTH